MDYDDNDFQSQNLHLPGEGSTKFPPVLRPYALPKFDFDESLQGNLRFDSLVETEVFLGIESNEDNQWIDAYSRGSSGIEFNSTAAESCSISRHNNVWSEATSSESVEMLLKSVGQEEFIPRETVIQESDACDELACLAKQMEPDPKPDDRNDFKDNVTDLQPPDYIHENLAGLRDVEREQSLAGVSQEELSIDGSLSNLQPHDMLGNVGLPMTRGILFTDGKSNDTNQGKVETVADGSVEEKTQEDLTASGVKTSITATSVQNISSTCAAGEAHHSDKPLYSIPMEETLESGNVVEGLETSGSILEGSLSMVSDVGVSKSECSTCPNFQQNVGTVEKTYSETSVSKEKELLNIGNQMDTKVLLSKSEASVFAVGSNDTSTVSKGNNDSKAGDFSSSGAVASKKSCISASQYLSENISLTSREMVDVPPPSKAVSTHEVTDHYEQRVVFVGSASIDENENSVSEIANEASCNDASSEAIIGNEASSEAKIANVASTEAKIANEGCSEAKIANEATTTLPVRSSEQETAPCPVTGTEKQDFSDTSRQLLCDTVSSCVTTASEKMGKPQETLGDKVDQECTKEVGVAAVLCESIEKPGDEVAVSFTKDDKEAIQENNDKSSSKISVIFLVTCLLFKFTLDLPCSCFCWQCPLHNKGCGELQRLISFVGDNLFANEGSKSSVPDSCSELHETGTNPTNPAENTCGASVIFGSNPETEKDVNQVKASAHLVSEYINKDALNTSTDHDPKGNDASKGERSLAPEVNPVMNLSKKDVSEKTTKRTNSSKKRQQAPVVEESSLTSALGTPKTKVAGNIPLGSPQISDGVIAHSVSQGTPERKTRRAYNKSAGKESSRKGNKGKTPGRQSERGDRSTSVSLSPSPGFQVMQSNEVQQYGHVDSIGTKPFAILNTSTSSLPDLNSSASPAVLFQQPFMDIQQVQLRAQIFVYGALIQGTVPDEAYMISAFGGPGFFFSRIMFLYFQMVEGAFGRMHGLLAWKGSMVKSLILLTQKHLCNQNLVSYIYLYLYMYRHIYLIFNLFFNFIELRSAGSRTTDVTVKQNALQGKGISSPLGLAGSKATPTVANPLVPLSSPLWSLPTPSCDPLQSSAFARGSVMDYSQALASLHPYQTTPLRNFLGHNTSWLSQTPLRGAWTPAPDNNNPHPSASPLTDTFQFSSVKVSSVPPSSSMKNAVPGLPASSAGLQSVFIATSPVLDTNNLMASNAQHSSDPKPKKRKKAMVSEDLGQKAVHLQSQLVPTPVVSSHISTVATATPVGSVPISVLPVTPLSLADHLKSDWNVEKRILSDDSIIGAAKEASRRRMEAASAARKRAENMDAILKAAELAAEAVSQAGKIVTMGDPLELNDLVEAGPGGCWNVAQESSQQVGLLKDVTSGLVNVDNVGDRLESSHICNRDNSSHEKGKKTAASENEKSSKGPKGRRVSDLVNPIDVLPESETEIKAAFTAGNGPENVEGNNFKEGSLVEVFKDGEGFKAAWYTANIISLKDGKAYVCYTVLVDDEGTGPLKEWVSLDGQDDKPPRIRTARTLTGLHNEGTKKRRRAALVDYTWSVGDRVDAWIQESWQEGVLTDKNKKDKTLTVHFPVSGETSVVRDWHLRPSLVWKDGKWIESPKVGAIESFTHEGDTPREKRPKLGNPAVEVKGKDKIPKGSDVVETANPGELRLLDLSENDKVFNIGKNSKNENKSDAQRMARTGLQKEGSRVIFGVPKPAKKRKFMEVSKHYVEDGTSKIKDGNDSVKLANFLIPHGTGSRGWKISSKNETKEKLGADSRPSFNRAERIKDSSSHFRSEHQVERASYSGNTGAGGGPILYSSVASSTDSHPTKKTSTSRASKGKLAPAGGGLGKIDEEKAFNENPVKSTSEITEPRRSNRRIQPTSRLLEGLQSSLIISKIPSASHEKGHKSQNRNTTRGENIYIILRVSRLLLLTL
uniref:Agenet domain-containing protein n=1 Tax=Cajanus cajan TaxID=3821 RepID=A0A151SKU1_CAJCA|nr:hypothetical protein KK1_001584 [Cajanus cajan]